MNNNEITAEFKRKIEIDIMKCKNQINKEGSEALYNELISKYTMFDPNFKSDISSTGKVAVLGEEFDYRPELKVIASKLEMIIDLNFKKNLYNAVKLNLDELIVEGYFICNYEVIDSNTSGLLFSYVSGDEYKKWNTKIELFNERYLKEHPLYDQIKKFNNSNHFESLKKLIKEHFDNPSIKFEELKLYIPFWDKKENEWCYFTTLNSDSTGVKISINELPYIQAFIFEENRFYRKQVEDND